MDFFQEPTFTAFLALILSFVVAKIVSFVVSNSKTHGTSVDEGAVVTLDKELRVVSKRGKKRVKFVDDVLIRRVDRYQEFENFVDEKSGEIRVHQLGHNKIDTESGVDAIVEQCFDAREMEDADALNKGCEEIVEMVTEKQCETDSTLLGIDVKRVNDEEEMEFEVGTDEKGEDGEDEGKVTVEEDEEKRVRSDDDYEDWEGIERSDLEKLFAGAVNYLEYGGKGKEKDDDDDRLAKLGSDVQLQLYGLHKVAVEGPCHESQPMALKVSARARWNAWQRLGSMSREEAMEQYITVLSDSIPSWMHQYSAGDANPESETIVEGPILERESGSIETSIDRSPGEFVQKDDMI